MKIKLYLSMGKLGGFAIQEIPVGRVALVNEASVEMPIYGDPSYAAYSKEEIARNTAERWAQFLKCEIEEVYTHAYWVKKITSLTK